MLRKIEKFFKLKREDKKLFLEAYITLGMMRAAVLTISFKRLTRFLVHQKNKGEMIPLSDNEMQTAISIGQAIARAADYTPWESACLVQSLTAQRMLQKRGIPGVFYLGVMKDKESEEKMKAHAWSQCGDTIITGGEGHEEFSVLSVFRWGKE